MSNEINSEDFATECEYMTPAERSKALCKVLREHGHSAQGNRGYDTIAVIDDLGDCFTLANHAAEVLGWLGY